MQATILVHSTFSPTLTASGGDPSASQPLASSQPAMRVWAVSDIHTDYAQNLQWVEELVTGSSGGAAAEGFKQDALIVAGDVSDDLATLEKTLQLLADAFAHVFFVPGNHGERVDAASVSPGC